MILLFFAFIRSINNISAYPYSFLEWIDLNQEFQINNTLKFYDNFLDSLYTRGIQFFENYLYFILKNNKNYCLCQWDFKIDQYKYIYYNSSLIRSFSIDKFEKKLYLFFSNSFDIYSLKNLSLVETKTFINLKSSVERIEVVNQTIYIAFNDTISIYSQNDSIKIDEIKLNYSSLQLIQHVKEDQFLIWSSLWGSLLRYIDIKTKKIIKEERITIDNSRNLFKSKLIKENLLLVYNYTSNKFNTYFRIDNFWISTDSSIQHDFNQTIFRFDPRVKNISLNLEIIANESMDSIEYTCLLPHKITYSQMITNEYISNFGKLYIDQHGNRLYKIEIPHLKKNEKFNLFIYKSTIIRYKFYFNSTSIDFLKNIEITPDLINFTEDFSNSFYLNSSEVQNYSEILDKNTSNIFEKVQNIYKFAVNNISNVWDGKNEEVPAILRNLHGGCHEHALVQVALLRKLKIPSRMNWNYCPINNDISPFFFDHLIAEFWIPNIGFLPLDAMVPPKSLAGTTYGYHMIFCVFDGRRHELMRYRFGYFTGNKIKESELKLTQNLIWEFELIESKTI